MVRLILKNIKAYYKSGSLQKGSTKDRVKEV